MPEIHFSISHHIIYIFLGAIVSVVLSILVYRVTIPPISKRKRVLLIVLRSTSIFLIFMFLGEPVISILFNKVEKPVVCVLVDNSMSMMIMEKDKRRGDILKELLNSAIWNRLKNNADLVYVVFDGTARFVKEFYSDSLTFRGACTDISAAFALAKQLQLKYNIQAVVIMGDGIANSGGNPLYPAEDLALPVFAIGIGDTSEKKDILIKKVITNEIVYMDTKVPVNVRIHNNGYDGNRIQVSLFDGDSLLDERTLLLESGDNFAQFYFSATTEGMHKLNVNISKLPNELTYENNRFSFIIKVLKSKIKVALIAGSPGQDYAFIERTLKSDKNLETISFVEKKDGTFYSNRLTQQLLDSADCILLISFPTGYSNPGSIETVANVLREGKPFYLMISRIMDFRKLNMLGEILPFDASNIRNEEILVFVKISETQRNNAIFKVGSNYNIPELWSKLPPVFTVIGEFKPRAGSQVLATIRYQNLDTDAPFIIANNMNKKKSIVVLGYGLWRWKMLTDKDSESEKILDSFISNSIRWLTTKEDDKKIRIEPVKSIFSPQEPVEFIAQIYDDNYQPIDNASVIINLKYKEEVLPLLMNPLSNGQYQGVYDYLPQGDYSYVASVVLNSDTIGKDTGSFSVGGTNIEFMETKMNKLLLQQISIQNGGKYYNASDISRLPEDIVELPYFKPHDLQYSRQIEIWNSKWFLFLIVILLSAEWFIRKQAGML